MNQDIVIANQLSGLSSSIPISSTPPPVSSTISNVTPSVADPDSPEDEVKKKKQRRVNKACVYCNRSHMSCENARPCRRCIDRGIAQLCRDHDSKKRRGRKGAYLEDLKPDKFNEIQKELTPPSPISPNHQVSPNVSMGIPVKQEAGPTDLRIAMLPMGPPTFHEPPSIYQPATSNTYSYPSPYITVPSPPATSSSNNNNSISSNSNSGSGSNSSSNNAITHGASSDILKYELDLPNDLKSMLSDFFFSTLDEIDRYWKDTDPVISTIPSIDEEYFNRLIALVRYRAVDEKEDLVQGLFQYRENIKKYAAERYRITLNMAQNLMSMKNEIASLVNTYKEIFENLATPTIVFDRTGTIHYVNPMYRAITNFNGTVPTPRFDLAFYKQLSPIGIKEYFKATLKILLSFPENLHINQFIINSPIRIWGDPSVEQWLDGTMAVTWKRDHVGLPFLVHATFLPKNIQNTFPLVVPKSQM